MRVVLQASLGVALLTHGIYAQKTQPAPVQGTRPTEQVRIPAAVTSWAELLEIQKSMPAENYVIYRAPEVTYEFPPIEISMDGKTVLPREQTGGVEKLLPCSGFNTEPPVFAGFDSQLDVADANGFSFIPPDVAGAVGPNHLMTMLQNKVLIQDRTGVTVSSVDTSAFWSVLGTTPLAPTTTYQRVSYDPVDGRWIATAREGTLAALNTRLFFAISDTNDPTGLWSFYSITADTAGVPTQAADWVVHGFNNTWITITANMLNSAGTVNNGAKMWTVDKSTALIPGGPITVSIFATGFMTATHGSGGSSLHPARTVDGTSTLYLVNDSFISGVVAGNVFLLQITQITGTGAAPIVSGIPGSPFGGTTSFCIFGQLFSSTQRTMAQIGDARFISAFSVRMASNFVRNGKLWVANSGGLPGPQTNTTPTSNGLVWQEIDPALPFPPGAPPHAAGTTMVVNSGQITNGVNTMSMYPSVAVNCAEDVLIGFANGDATRNPRACYTMRLAGDPHDFMGAIQELKAGESSYWKNFGVGTTAQYGRYSSTCVDPNDDRTLWTLQEYADTRVGPADNDSRWGTWWGRLGECENLPAPSISMDPTDLTVCLGDPASFTVTAAGGQALFYQWRKNGVDIPGATSATYNIAASVASDAGMYDVVVRGCGAELSAAATLDFGGAVVTTDPVTQFVAVGGTAVFFVAATGTGTLSYQWYHDGNPVGPNSDTLTISPVTLADYGDYYCEVTDSCGPDNSAVARLNFEKKNQWFQQGELSFHIFKNPTSQAVCVGDPLNLTILAYPAGVTYDWRKNGFSTGQTSATFSIPSFAAADAGNYDCVVTFGANMKTSATAVVVSNDIPTITAQPAPVSQTISPGSDVTFSVGATGDGVLKYQWQFRPAVPFASFSNLPGEEGPTLELFNVTAGGSYRCVITNHCGLVRTRVCSIIIL